MSRLPFYAFSILAAGAALAAPALGQAVISTRSGLIHFFEGSVSVAGQPLEARFGKFTSIPEGGELRTGQGRAEVLLTPGVILRIGENSAIRMAANNLADTRVEMLSGSAIMDSAAPAAGTAVTLIFKDWKVQQPEKGSYRIDADPPRVQVREGEVQVSTAGGSAPVQVEQGMELPFASVLVPEKSNGALGDALNDWAEGRAEAVSADNSIAANIQDPASMTGLSLPADSFTYFPMVGLSSFGTGLADPYGSLGTYQSGFYGSLTPYQTGFYSLYLPGYTQRPLLWRLPSTGLQRGLYSPTRIGSPTTPIRSPGIRPVTPIAPHVGVHVGVRR